MSKNTPTTAQKIAIFTDALSRGESEAVARSLARTNTPVEYKQLERYIELIENGTNRVTAAEIVNLRPHHLASLMKRHPDYAEAINDARSRYFESLVDQLPALGENAETPVELGIARLKSDNIKWVASKIMPKQYGDRMAVEVEHKINLSSVLLEAESRIIPVVGPVVTEIASNELATRALIPHNAPSGDATSGIIDTDAYPAQPIGEPLDEDMFS